MKNQLLSVCLFAFFVAVIPMFALKIPQNLPAQTLGISTKAISNTQELNESPAINSLPEDSQSNNSAINSSLEEPQSESSVINSSPEESQVGELPKQAPLEATKTIHETGTFALLDESTGKQLHLTTQEYVRGAVAAEMPPTFHPEAMKAQAVASHTYALCVQQIEAQSPTEKLKGADFSCNTKEWKSYVTKELFYERYGALAESYWNTICEATDAVSDYVLLYEEKPIVAAYHSMSVGMTEDGTNVWTGQAPYLLPVESRGDPLAPDYEYQVELDQKEVRKALEAAFPGITLEEAPEQWISLEERSPSGYLLQAQVGDRNVHGKELRMALDLRSSALEVDYDGQVFTFTTKGYGHGVGLSQYGADFYGRQGMDFWKILSHYYTGVQLGVAIS